MSKIVKLPVRSADPDAPISLRTWAQRGGSPVISLEAVLRWSPGFDPHAAAASCLLAANFEAAVDFWREHVAAFRDALKAMGLAAGTTDILVSRYTAATRREVRILREAKMPREAWVAESFSTFDTAVHL